MSEVRDTEFAHLLDRTFDTMNHMGLLVGSLGDRPNLMTIGWGTAGIQWGKTVFNVMVRPSRFTKHLIDATGEFVIDVPAPDMTGIVASCGKLSGADHDKVAELGLAMRPGRKVEVPVLCGCPIVFECRVVAAMDIVPRNLVDGSIADKWYPDGDFHRLYIGEILAAYEQ